MFQNIHHMPSIAQIQIATTIRTGRIPPSLPKKSGKITPAIMSAAGRATHQTIQASAMRNAMIRKFLRWLFYRRVDPQQFTDGQRLANGMRAVNEGRRR